MQHHEPPATAATVVAAPPPPRPARPPRRPKSAFAFETRVLCCAECGAPLAAGLAGGMVRCGYCQANNLIERRDTRRHRSAGRLPPPALEEAKRIDRLRTQVGKELEVPFDLRRLLAAGQIEARHVSRGLRDWLSTHKRVRRARAAFHSDRLFHLTQLLAPRVDPHVRRALLETALETLILPRHQQLLRAELARGAAIEGNVAAAVSWLTPCDPHSADLHMDTAYRLTAAIIAAARDDRAEILALLGGREGDVPIAPEGVDEAEVLRIHACETLVGVKQARQRLNSCLESPVRLGGILRALRAGAPIGLCEACWPPLEEVLFAQWDEALRVPPNIAALVIAHLSLFAAGLALGASLIWSDGDAVQGSFILLGMLGIGTVALSNNHRRIQLLRRAGLLSIGHLVNASASDYHPNFNSYRHEQGAALEFAIETRDGLVRVTTKRHILAPTRRGSFPLLYDPDAPHNCRILVQGSAAEPLEILRPLPHQASWDS